MAHKIERQFMTHIGAVDQRSPSRLTLKSKERMVWAANSGLANSQTRDWLYETYPPFEATADRLPVYTHLYSQVLPTGIERHTLSLGRFYITWLEEHPVVPT